MAKKDTEVVVECADPIPGWEAASGTAKKTKAKKDPAKDALKELLKEYLTVKVCVSTEDYDKTRRCVEIEVLFDGEVIASDRDSFNVEYEHSHSICMR